MLHLVMSYMSQTGNLNKPSKMRITDWESFLGDMDGTYCFTMTLS